MERETLVVEMECQKAVGTDAAGQRAIIDNIRDIANILNQALIAEPVTHESPLYGLSAWGPLKKGAVHSYAWDHLHGKNPPFISIDVTTVPPMTDEQRDEIIRSTVELFEGVPKSVVYKTSNNPDSTTWREIAPHIIRQRIAIDGTTESPITADFLSKYMIELCQVLNMVQLSDPLTIETKDGITAWVHWETSGAHARYDKKNGEFTTDIYTCKSFDPHIAEDFTQKKMGLKNLSTQNY